MKSEEKYDILYNEKMNTSALCRSTENGFFGAEVYCSPYMGHVTEKDILFSRSQVTAPLKYELEKAIISNAPSGTNICFGLNGLCYPPQESVFRLTERALEIMYDLKNPITVITKSDLILRDAGLISTIAGRSGATVFIPIFCEDNVSPVFEPYTPLPSFRFEMINRLSASGIRCGVIISPVIPYITDSASAVLRLTEKAAASGAELIVFDPSLRLTEKQKPLFQTALNSYYPDFMRFYGTFSENLYFPPMKMFITECVEKKCEEKGLKVIRDMR